MEFSLRPSGDYRDENLNLTGIANAGYEHLDNMNTVLLSRLNVEPPEFQPLTKAQLRGALNYFNVLKRFDEFADKAEPTIKQRWQSANEFNRQDEFINEIAKKLQLTNRQLDFIFEIGITL